jgi:hypothetical protein
MKMVGQGHVLVNLPQEKIRWCPLNNEIIFKETDIKYKYEIEYSPSCLCPK